MISVPMRAEALKKNTFKFCMTLGAFWKNGFLAKTLGENGRRNRNERFIVN